MNAFRDFMTYLMELCYKLCKNYGLAIILFTFFSKVIMLPISIWIQKNSIKMVRMQPDLNRIMIAHYGDRDTISEKQAQLYKKEKYNPFISVIPMFFQLFLLFGVIEAIKGGMANPDIQMMFLGIDLSIVPSEGHLLQFIWAPLLAAFSAFLLCFTQNKSNVLQAEQSPLNQYGIMALSVALSLYLGCFVSIGVVVYWIASNVMAIIQMYLLNIAINPKKYVDYEDLEETRAQLRELKKVGAKKKISKENKRRERADYKKFFSVVNKHIVFYSESSGFYKYYKGYIDYLLENTEISIHYVTSDENDQIFELAKTNSRIRPYLIYENRLITLMMKMDADMVVMTMPDLQNYHIKRSYVRKDVRYIYIPHGMDSLNMTMRKASMNHYDVIFCAGKHQLEEIVQTEEVYKLPKKKLIEVGYPLLDEMRMAYQKMEQTKNEKPTVLIAPSWQKDNIMDICIESLLDGLKDSNFYVVVRPHPQFVRHMSDRIEALKNRYADCKTIEFQTDFSSNSTVYTADVMITDWSGIAYEYAFTTNKPVVFIDTPPKIMNEEYDRISVEPMNIWIRDQIGKIVSMNQTGEIAHILDDLMQHYADYQKTIEEMAKEYIYNLDESAKIGGECMITELEDVIEHKEEP